MDLQNCQQTFNKKEKPLTEEYLVRASKIIQQVYVKESNVSVYLLCGLAWLLTVNDSVDKSYSEDEIIESFLGFCKNKQNRLCLLDHD